MVTTHLFAPLNKDLPGLLGELRPFLLLMLIAVMGLSARPAMANDSAALQCVPYARDVSGIQIYGDAHTWWHQADGKYARGTMPAPGAVMAFKPMGSMQLGHVAAISRIIDNRTVLLDHANWSTINGTRGHIERDVMAVDVSNDNDWSEVRVWYTPINGLGTTHYPIEGFIYPVKPGQEFAPPPVQYAAAKPRPSAATPRSKPTVDRGNLSASADRFVYETANTPPETGNSFASNDPIGDLLEQLGQ